MTDETFQWFTPEAEEAIRAAIAPQPMGKASREAGYTSPDGGESYECENCPAEFHFQPEGFKCPLCGRGLTGTVTINFYPPQPPDADECEHDLITGGITSCRKCGARWPRSEPEHVPSDPGARCN